jgi:hypothetical protein
VRLWTGFNWQNTGFSVECIWDLNTEVGIRFLKRRHFLTSWTNISEWKRNLAALSCHFWVRRSTGTKCLTQKRREKCFMHIFTPAPYELISWTCSVQARTTRICDDGCVHPSATRLNTRAVASPAGNFEFGWLPSSVTDCSDAYRGRWNCSKLLEEMIQRTWSCLESSKVFTFYCDKYPWTAKVVIDIPVNNLM